MHVQGFVRVLSSWQALSHLLVFPLQGVRLVAISERPSRDARLSFPVFSEALTRTPRPLPRLHLNRRLYTAFWAVGTAGCIPYRGWWIEGLRSATRFLVRAASRRACSQFIRTLIPSILILFRTTLQALVDGHQDYSASHHMHMPHAFRFVDRSPLKFFLFDFEFQPYDCSIGLKPHLFVKRCFCPLYGIPAFCSSRCVGHFPCYSLPNSPRTNTNADNTWLSALSQCFLNRLAAGLRAS